MDNLRLLLWGALAALLWLHVINWQRDYAAPVAITSPSTTASAQAANKSSELPPLPAGEQSSVPPVQSSLDVVAQASTGESSARQVDVTTDVLRVVINTQGGELDTADLLKYPKVKNEPGVPFRLFNAVPGDLYVARSGLRAPVESAAPTHLAIYHAAKPSYELASDQDKIEARLTWTSDSGVTIDKIYTFSRGSYVIDLRYEVVNAGSSEWKAASYVQLVRHFVPAKRSMFDVETYSFKGPAIYDGKSYRRLKVDDEDDRKFEQSFASGWMAALQHHFVAAVVPPAGESYDYQLRVDSESDFVLTARGPLKSVAPGASAQFTERLFVGPKLQETLASVGPKLERTADYGRLTIIAEPLFWVLSKIHSWIGNWGVTIILTTLLIKLVFYKLTETSGRSMAKMRNLSPRIKSVQERYKDDREQLGRAMMDLYKREKINPLAGCLPILVQVPVFMGFYWVLLESVEMRQAPFFGWISDLSSRDPFFVLPALMGAAMFMQFKLQPASPDPMQAKVLQFMPLVMTVMMAWFPAGLVVYWLTNTLLSIAQQWNINRVVALEAKKAN
jgi:YidC/Oxa1 family membrane protein insertase